MSPDGVSPGGVPPGGVVKMGISSNIAVAVTFAVGIVNTAFREVTLVLCINITAGIICHFLNCCPEGGVFAVMCTVAPAAKSPVLLPVLYIMPFSSVTLYVGINGAAV